MIPKYKCRDCGAVFCGWAKQDICPKCGGKLEPVFESSATNNEEVVKLK